MTSVELKQLREQLDLSAEWCAKHVGRLKSARAWWYWEAGKNGEYTAVVPDDVAVRMRALAAAIPRALAVS